MKKEEINDLEKIVVLWKNGRIVSDKESLRLLSVEERNKKESRRKIVKPVTGDSSKYIVNQELSRGESLTFEGGAKLRIMKDGVMAVRGNKKVLLSTRSTLSSKIKDENVDEEEKKLYRKSIKLIDEYVSVLVDRTTVKSYKKSLAEEGLSEEEIKDKVKEKKINLQETRQSRKNLIVKAEIKKIKDNKEKKDTVKTIKATKKINKPHNDEEKQAEQDDDFEIKFSRELDKITEEIASEHDTEVIVDVDKIKEQFNKPESSKGTIECKFFERDLSLEEVRKRYYSLSRKNKAKFRIVPFELHKHRASNFAERLLLRSDRFTQNSRFDLDEDVISDIMRDVDAYKMLKHYYNKENGIKEKPKAKKVEVFNIDEEKADFEKVSKTTEDFEHERILNEAEQRRAERMKKSEEEYERMSSYEKRLVRNFAFGQRNYYKDPTLREKLDIYFDRDENLKNIAIENDAYSVMEYKAIFDKTGHNSLKIMDRIAYDDDRWLEARDKAIEEYDYQEKRNRKREKAKEIISRLSIKERYILTRSSLHRRGYAMERIGEKLSMLMDFSGKFRSILTNDYLNDKYDFEDVLDRYGIDGKATMDRVDFEKRLSQKTDNKSIISKVSEGLDKYNVSISPNMEAVSQQEGPINKENEDIIL